MAMQSRQPPGGSSTGLPATDRLTDVQENLVTNHPQNGPGGLLGGGDTWTTLEEEWGRAGRG